MVNIKTLQGVYLKNLLGAKRVQKTYHNHNKSGGNFGFVIVMNNKKLSHRDDGEKWYRLDGEHNTEGEITHLNFSDYGSWTPEGDADKMILYNKLLKAGLFEQSKSMYNR
jgi:hypothetical protein